MQDANTREFVGAKLALFVGPLLVVIQRDDFAHIPFPGFWDLPGGGREGGESPQQCALRETEEEIGLRLRQSDIVWSRTYSRDIGLTWFFAAHLPLSAQHKLKLGDEGQRMELWMPEDFVTHPRAVPHFRRQVLDYLKSSGQSKRVLAC